MKEVKGVALTNEEFLKIKQLLSYKGVSRQFIVQLTGRSLSMVGNIKRVGSFEEYKALVNAYIEKSKKRLSHLPVKEPEVVTPTVPKTTEQLLQEISDKLEKMLNIWKL